MAVFPPACSHPWWLRSQQASAEILGWHLIVTQPWPSYLTLWTTTALEWPESIFPKRPAISNYNCPCYCSDCYSRSVAKSCSTLSDLMDCNPQATHFKGWIPQTHPTACPHSQTRHLPWHLSVWSPIGPMVMHNGCGLDDWGAHWSTLQMCFSLLPLW